MENDSVAVTKEGSGSCSRNCSGVMTESLMSVGGSMMPPELRRLASDMLVNEVSCKAGTGVGWSTRLETGPGCNGSGCSSGAVAALTSFGGSGVMVGAGVTAGEDVFEDFGWRPGALFAVLTAGLAAVLVVVARLAGALRAVLLVVAFFAASRAFRFSSFSFSRASYSSLEGIFNVTRFKPEVSASISLFSLSFTVATLLV